MTRDIKYITPKRARFHSLTGDVNIPYGTELESDGHYIYYNNKPICLTTSQNAHRYFVINNDNHGLERYELTSEIISILSNQDDDYQTRWNKIWEDHVCKRYRREEHKDMWIWSHKFFNAQIFDLQHIIGLIK